jgi:ABC-type antimicrobial peptide transport system ATPase subunit
MPTLIAVILDSVPSQIKAESVPTICVAIPIATQPSIHITTRIATHIDSTTATNVAILARFASRLNSARQVRAPIVSNVSIESDNSSQSCLGMKVARLIAVSNTM